MTRSRPNGIETRVPKVQWQAIFERALKRRAALLEAYAQGVTTAFRLVNAEGDGAAGIAIDRYGEWLVLHARQEVPASQRDECLRQLEKQPCRGVYLKIRPRQANTLVDARERGLAPSTPVLGDPAPTEHLVYENGLPFEVHLGEGLGTGLFLDQRSNRKKVRDLASHRTVLNLFAYTCSFGVAAAAGGASEVTHVDVSASALRWGQRNTARVESGSVQNFARRDVFDTLSQFARQGRQFDLVILDPPTYSRSRNRRFVSSRDYSELASAAMRVTSSSGALLACSNDHRLAPAHLEALLRESARAHARRAEIALLPPPEDFPSPPRTPPHLKTAVVHFIPG